MPAEGEIRGDSVVLVPVAADRIDAVLTGDLDGRTAGPGWPHEDTMPGLSFARAGGSTWLIVGPDDTVVGDIGTKAAPDRDGRVEIGYGLAAPTRGRGLGTRAVATLLHALFRRPNVAVVEARVDPGNEPSWRLLRRLGFTMVGHEAGQDVYELRRHEFSPGPP